MHRYFVGILLLMGLVLILVSGCNGNNETSGQAGEFTVSGTVATRFNDPIPQAVVTLFTNTGAFAGQTFTDAFGNFTLIGVTPDTYFISADFFLGNTKIDVVSAPFSVTTSNVSGVLVTAPILQDLLGIPISANNGTLAVFVTTQSGVAIPSTVSVEGVPGFFSSQDGRAVVSNVPLGNRDVIVQFDAQTIIRHNVPFSPATITVLEIKTNEVPVGTFTVSGTVFSSLGVPVVGIAVALEQNGTPFAETVTSQNGTFTFTNVTPGTYVAVAEQTINGFPVFTQSEPFTVINANVTGIVIQVPSS
ncbi:MAG TPA: carboxypeptidase-like regulatory domain-containing protein [Armatimonadota bacterium]|nr:carboxypeptidase-like regulatory domain-containing protein [Armatimonadota bacterium]